MARAVQCPACGEAHPVDSLAGTPTFACNGCGRTLRTPTELVRPSGATPAVRGVTKAVPKTPPRTASARPAPPPPRPARGRVEAAAAPAPSAEPAPRKPRPPRVRKHPAVLGLPARIGAWIVAVVLGLILTWFVASAVGFVSRSQIVDMFRSSTPTNYTRLFLLIPVWAFISACLATAFIEGARVVAARRAGTTTSTGRRGPSRPSAATRLPDVDEPRSEAIPPREPLPPGQRTRIRPREPTV